MRPTTSWRPALGRRQRISREGIDGDGDHRERQGVRQLPTATLVGHQPWSGSSPGDTVSVLSRGTGTFVTKDAGLNKTVNITGTTLQGADAGNYSVNPTTTTADITPSAVGGHRHG